MGQLFTNVVYILSASYTLAIKVLKQTVIFEKNVQFFYYFNKRSSLN